MTNSAAREPVRPNGNHRDKVDFTTVRWRSVEWTNLCVLYLRAYESRLPQSILGDYMADEAVGRIDYDFERIHRAVRPATNQFMVALRGVLFDRFTSEYLTRHPEAVVLHLGCGLHSRAFRLTAAKGVRWFDVDLPKVIALRRQLYAESETYRMIGSSVTDRDWIDELPEGGPVLIAAEGLLMYLSPAEITDLLRRLLDRFDTGELLADVVSAWGPRLSKVITWGTNDGAEIARWESRLRLVEDSPVMAGFDRIPLTPQRLLYRTLHVIPPIRNYDRFHRFAF
ncbi:MAG: class I SAM-dependent methyltransferase [Mycobacterium sp.]